MNTNELPKRNLHEGEEIDFNEHDEFVDCLLSPSDMREIDGTATNQYELDFQPSLGSKKKESSRLGKVLRNKFSLVGAAM